MRNTERKIGINEKIFNEIQISNNSILQSEVDAIVNPANPQLLRGGGLSGIIHEALMN